MTTGRPLAAAETIAADKSPARLHSWALPALTLLLAAVGLFARLGNNALWGDEANTALIAQGVWRTGDTSAVVGENIVAYRNGAELTGTMERYMPPLQYYLAAPFVALGPTSALFARLPFALCGLATIALMLHWARRQQADGLTRALLSLAILGNVSLFLFFRQSRYYGPAMLATVAIAYFYHTWNGRPGRLIAMAVCSLVLLASNYLNFLALYACLAVDYALWHRRRRRLGLKNIAILLAPQVLLGGMIVHIWNPLGKPVLQHVPASWLTDRLLILGWSFRDIGACEFGVLALLIAAPLLYLATKNAWLIRGSLALLIYIVVTTLLSPQTVHALAPDGRVATVARFAEVRYLSPTIPLCIVLGVLALTALRRWLKGMVLLVAVLAFGSNVLHGGWIYDSLQGRADLPDAPAAPWLIHSTLYRYLHELARPPTDPYRLTSDWIGANVPAGKSVLVLPGDMAYPLMFHAPRALYAWQLEDPAPPALRDLPAIHFRGRAAPDYVVAFGPGVQDLRESFRGPPPTYRQAAKLDVFWREAHRPELFAHVFGGVRYYNHSDQVIYIFQADPSAGPASDAELIRKLPAS